MTPTEPYDPETTVWRAVAQLEKKGYTKGEILDTLDKIADQVYLEDSSR